MRKRAPATKWIGGQRDKEIAGSVAGVPWNKEINNLQYSRRSSGIERIYDRGYKI